MSEYSIEALLEDGLLLAPEQQAYYENHLQGDPLPPAVFVWGVPDPDFDDEGDMQMTGKTLVQRELGTEGSPVVLPQILANRDPVDLEEFSADDGLYRWESDLPYVVGAFNLPMNRIFRRAVVQVAPWDLWPVEEHEIDVYETAVISAWEASNLDALFRWYLLNREGKDIEDDYDDYSNWYDPITPDYEDLEQLKADLERQLWVDGVWGPRVPDPDLPIVQATTWRLLKAQSEDNWALLEKREEAASGGDVGRVVRFVRNNRGLCPWY